MDAGKRGGQMSESFILGALMAVVGGYLDVYTYLLRGHVFANAQTGNIVLLGVNLAEGAFVKAIYYLVPIAAFAAGVLAVEVIRKRFYDHPRIHWRQITVAAECVVLLGVAFIPAGKWDIAVNPVISFLCAMQVESFRKFKGGAFATTMCTGNLRTATELLYRYRATGDKECRRRSLQYYAIILFFIGGAVLGTAGAGWFAEKAVLFCCALLAAGFCMMFIKNERSDGLGA